MAFRVVIDKLMQMEFKRSSTHWRQRQLGNNRSSIGVNLVIFLGGEGGFELNNIMNLIMRYN